MLKADMFGLANKVNRPFLTSYCYSFFWLYKIKDKKVLHYFDIGNNFSICY